MTHLWGPVSPTHSQQSGAIRRIIYRENGHFGLVSMKPASAGGSAKAQAFLDYAKGKKQLNKKQFAQAAAAIMQDFDPSHSRSVMATDSQSDRPLFAVLPRGNSSN